ncbi:MAG: DUF4358 domain-containing protein [Clostridia bacterium]|nr:DUF4358 domain-containing protein [Clostridia bacterium]
MKKYFRIIPVIALLIILAGCGKIEEIVISELGDVLGTSVAFSEQLTQIDTANIEKRYLLNSKDYSEITAFVGTAAVCDEYVIVKTDATEAMAEKLGRYIEEKRKTYKKYRPDEVGKLDNAIIETYENAVVMIVTADSENALDVYKEYLKK